MNVAFDPWIPVVTTTGERKLTSLWSVLAEGGRYADLAVRPHERVALMRLFLCVAYAALDGPKDYDEWREVPERLPEKATHYLKEWKDLFELFHQTKPWLQVAELTQNRDRPDSPQNVQDWTPVSKLHFAFATGNNSTLFDHEGMSEERNIALEETILSMLTFQCFSVGGLLGQIFWNGIRCGELANQKKENGPVKSADAPCVPKSMIHAFLRGASFQETIHLNLPTQDDIRFAYGNRSLGRPVWEMMPASLNDSAKIENATGTYIGRLVPMTRLIRLHSTGERMLLGDGLAYPSFTDGFPQEPTATVVVRTRNQQEERAILSYQPAKALWRELAAIVVNRTAQGLGGPLSLRALQEDDTCDLIVAALARDKATIVDTVESVFHIPSRLRAPAGTVAYETEVKKGEGIASHLGWAVETYRREVDPGWEGRLKSAGPAKNGLKEKLHSSATTHYWTTVEKNLTLLMRHIEAIGTDDAIPSREAWRKMLFAAACEAYRIACGQDTPRHIRAFAKGWRKLTAKDDRSETHTNETEEEKV